MSQQPLPPAAERVGETVVHRRYVPYSHAHYAGNLVDGAWSLGLFGDVATEMCIRTDGDEGLFASYSDVQFRGPVRAGDVVEVRCRLVRAGSRSREMEFELLVVARGAATADDPGASHLLAEPLVVTTARGTVVVPPRPAG
ncbi:hotdog fold domain-containing protein [Nocardioides solisilvae]|uniref:3-aminobutyryl-CoA ammonia lyase n=1 Tax=Nocardioides solisilvae TaxID=1542435 RepID=UPI000D743C2C|nr:hotdog fold domain-containing protein [Nocardioides solisilvae]